MREKQISYFDIIVCLATVISVVIADRLTKILFSNILQLGESLPVIKKVFHFTLVHNTGIAFGLFKDNGFVFLIIPLIAVVLLGYNLYYYHKVGELDAVYILGFSMILGGAIGNLTDRIMLGHVIDFIDLRIWPVFNIADSAITVGACLVLFKCFFPKPVKKPFEPRFNLPD
ncbi:MAG: signal peptidase II [Candidatus Omnitrophica bacterium]|nr:signal peptidase II [Candidatus Omnitrophota bacterium]